MILIPFPNPRDYLERTKYVGKGDIPCMICGRPLRATSCRHWLLTHNCRRACNESERDKANTGYYPICVEHLETYPRLKPYIHRKRE